MQLPIISDFKHLSSAPRRFLAFSGSNVASWQCIVGPAMILFARSIDMPASWVGVMLSFLPFSMILVAATLPLVTRLGSKKLMMMTWLARNLWVSSIFAMPWVVANWGTRAGWGLMLISVSGFCLLRALGVGGWFPWLHEVVPEKDRGRFFSTEIALVHFLNVIIITSQGLWLTSDSTIWAFLAIYTIGLAAGLSSLFLMWRIPGGQGCPKGVGGAVGFAAYKVAFADRRYLRFILFANLCFMALAWWSSSGILFYRDILGLSDRTNMLITASCCGGLLLSIKAWGRFAEHSGSGRTIFKSLIAFSLLLLLFLLYRPGGWGMLAAVWGTAIFINVYAGAYWSAIHRAMLNFVQEEGRIGYTNIWMVSCAISQGITPILAGQLIQRLDLLGFRICFLCAGVLGLIGAFTAEWIIGDTPPAARPKERLMNPALPVRTLARIVWITAGMHESNREEEE